MTRRMSKNGRRDGSQALISKWGGKIIMKSVFENGRMRHLAVCDKTGNEGRKPRDLM